MLTSGAKVLAGGAIAGITAVTYYIVTRSRSKAARDAEAPGAPPAKAARLLPEEASPRVDEFGLLGHLVDLDEFYELVRHCSAIDAVRLSRCSVALHERLADPSTAAWCAESRRALLRRRRRAGDLPLDTQGAWTLERLHLCERPPRFPRVYFEFAADELTAEGKQRVRRVARLLARHPKLRVRIHGYAQPNAPGPIGECLAQARATAVRAHCVRLLQDPGNAATHAPSYAAEDPASGVRPELARDPWHAYPAGCTRLVGQRLTATGMWLKQPRNRNFEAQGEEEAAAEEADGGDGRDGFNGDGGDGDEGDALVGGDGDSDGGGDDDDDEDDGSKLRRAEFTLLGLDD